MTTTRVILSGIAGGLAMFVWGAVSHMALPIGEMGVSQLPNEAPVVSAISGTVSQRGFYFFPGMVGDKKSEAAQKEWQEKIDKGPTGIVIYNPAGGGMMPKLLLIELASNIGVSIIIAVMLSRMQAPKVTRMLLSGAMGFAAWLAIDVSYWNWYKFPDTFALAGMIDQTVGWLVAGVAIVLVLGRGRVPQTA